MSPPDTTHSAQSPPESLADALNRTCRCIAVDADRLRAALESRPATAGLYASILENQPNLFSASAVFVSRDQLAQMATVIEAAEAAIATEGYRREVLAWAPEIARVDHGPRGVFLGYDFHVGPDGPRLIEINTNAGGALLNTALAAAELACCPEVESLIAGPTGGRLACPGEASDGAGSARGAAVSSPATRPCVPPADGQAHEPVSPCTLDHDAVMAEARAIEAGFVEMFREEWRRARGAAPLRRVAIVDDQPEAQYLHPEFVLFRELFAEAGIRAEVVDPRALEHAGGALRLHGEPTDLVYNRLTDFALDTPASAALRTAYLADQVIVTPHPRAHALYADKRNLALLSDPARLRALGVPEAAVAVLAEAVPHTVVVDRADAESWWRERRRWFFKPVAGYASKAAYRGDKITRGAFSTVLEQPYVAQAIVPPSERTIVLDGTEVPLKLDLRNYVYAGRVQLVAARLYSGQTTNFRTPGGGFAPVFTERAR